MPKSVVLEFGAVPDNLELGLKKQGRKVYAKTIPDASSKTLAPIIERKAIRDSLVYFIEDEVNCIAL
jgi:hypothetical protein